MMAQQTAIVDVAGEETSPLLSQFFSTKKNHKPKHFNPVLHIVPSATPLVPLSTTDRVVRAPHKRVEQLRHLATSSNSPSARETRVRRAIDKDRTTALAASRASKLPSRCMQSSRLASSVPPPAANVFVPVNPPPAASAPVLANFTPPPAPRTGFFGATDALSSLPTQLANAITWADATSESWKEFISLTQAKSTQELNMVATNMCMNFDAILTKSVATASVNANHFAGNLKDIASEAATLFSKTGGVLVASTTALYCYIQCYKSFDKWLALLGSAALLAAAYLSGALSYCASSLLSYIASWRGVQRASGGYDDLARLVSSILAYVSIAQAPSAKQAAEAMRAFSGWERASRGIKETCEWLVDCFRRFRDLVRHWLGLPTIERTSTGITDLDNWVLRAATAAEDHKVSTVVDPDTFAYLTALINEGRRLPLGFSHMTERTQVMNVVSAWNRVLEPIAAIHEAAGANTLLRTPPLGIMIAGGPGIGKSTMVTDIISRLLVKIHERDPAFLKVLRDHPNLWTYIRNAADPYMSGARNDHIAFVWNDAFQNVQPNTEALELMSVMDGFPVHAVMADLASKGTIYPRPLLGVVTTNCEIVPQGLLRVTEALARRFPVRVRASISDDWCADPSVPLMKRTYNPTRITPGCGWKPEALQFEHIDWAGQPIGPPISYEAFIAFAISKLEALRANSDAIMVDHQKLHKDRCNEAIAALNPKPHVPNATTPIPASVHSPTPTLAVPVLKEKGHVESIDPQRCMHNEEDIPFGPNLFKKMSPTERADLAAHEAFERSNGEQCAGLPCGCGLSTTCIECLKYKFPKFRLHPRFKTILQCDCLVDEGEVCRWCVAVKVEPLEWLSEALSSCDNLTKINSASNPTEFKFVESSSPTNTVDKVDWSNYEDILRVRPSMRPTNTIFAWSDFGIFEDPESPVHDIRNVLMNVHPTWRFSVLSECAIALLPAYRQAQVHSKGDQFILRLRTANLDSLLAQIKVKVPEDYILKLRIWCTSVLASMKQVWTNFWSSSYGTQLVEVMKVLSMVIISYSVLAIIIFVIVTVFKYIFRPKSKAEKKAAKQAAKDAERSSTAKSPNITAPGRTLPTTTVTVTALPTRAADSTSDQIAQKTLAGNLFAIDSLSGGKIINFVVVCERICLINCHFKWHVEKAIKEGQMKPTDVVEAYPVTNPDLRYHLRVQDILEGTPLSTEETEDTMVFHWSNKTVNQCPNILDYFLSSEEHKKYCAEGTFGKLMTNRPNGEILSQVLWLEPREQVPMDDGIPLRHAYHFHSPAFTRGDCGSVAFAYNVHTAHRKILGIFTASDGINGYLLVVPRERLIAAMAKYGPLVKKADPPAAVEELVKAAYIKANSKHVPFDWKAAVSAGEKSETITTTRTSGPIENWAFPLSPEVPLLDNTPLEYGPLPDLYDAELEDLLDLADHVKEHPNCPHCLFNFQHPYIEPSVLIEEDECSTCEEYWSKFEDPDPPLPFRTGADPSTTHEYFQPQLEPVSNYTHGYLLGNFPIIAQVPREAIPYVAEKSRIVPTPYARSPMCPQGPRKVPAPLAPFRNDKNEFVIPMHVALEKYKYKCIPLANLTNIEECCDAEFAHLMDSGKLLPPHKRGILSFEVAVAGDPSDSNLKGIPRNTSAGYPYFFMATPEEPHKTRWLDKEGIVNFLKDEMLELRTLVETMLEDARKGIRRVNICLDILKDELIKPEKAAIGASRFVSATSLPYLVFMRMLFGELSAYITQTRIINGTAIGVNPYSKEWADVASYLFGVSRHMFAGDFKGFDGSLNANVLWAIFDHIILPFYGLPADHPDSLARRVAFADLVNSLHIWKGTLYEWLCAHPSGHFLTAVLNSLYVRVVFRKAFIELHPQKALAVAEFDKNVAVIALGDDHVCSVSEFARQFFTPKAVASELAYLGMTYTSASKGEVEDKFVPLQDVTFLKRGFYYDNHLHHWMAPLELNSIQEMVLWHANFDVNHVISKDRFSIAMHELSLHPTSVWDTLSGPMFKCYAASYGSEFPIKSKRLLAERTLSTTWTDAPALSSIDASNLFGKYSRYYESSDVIATRCCLFELPGIVPATKAGSLDMPSTYPSSSRREEDAESQTREVIQPYCSAHGSGTPLELKQRPRHILQVHQPAGLIVMITETITNNIPVSTQENSIDTQNTSTIVSQGEVRTAAVDRPTSVPSATFNNTHNNPSVKDFTGNWIEAATGTVTTAMAAATQLASISLGPALFANAAIQSKLVGVQGIRGTMLVKVVLAATRNMQGTLQASWGPLFDQSAQVEADKIRNLTTLSQLPRALINISTTAECNLECPWLAPSMFHDLRAPGGSANGTWGKVYLHVISPLFVGSSGSTSFTWTMFLSMDPSTVELFNPTYNPTPGVASRCSGRGKMSVGEKEASASGKKPISAVLAAAGSVASAISLAAPQLSPLTLPVGWAINAAAGLASALGYSKPLDETPVNMQEKSYGRGLNNPDTPSTAQALSLYRSNKVQLMDNFAGSDVDEMAFANLLPKFAWMASFNWTSAATTGTVLYTNPCCPAAVRTSYTATAGTYYAAGPLGYISPHFAFFHGSLTYKFRFSKTANQQGRFMVAFYPGVSTLAGDATPVYASSIYAHREYVDLSAGDEFTFVAPFTSQFPYCSVDEAYGQVVVYIVSPLTYDSTVASSIQCDIEIAAAPGFELINPRTSPWAPITLFGATEPLPSRAMNFADKMMVVTPPKAIGGAAQPDQGLELAKIIPGESVISLRPLMSAMTPLLWTTTLATNAIAVRAFSCGITTQVLGAWSNSDFGLDYYAKFMPMFLLQRGSVITNLYGYNTGTGTFQGMRAYQHFNVNQTLISTQYTDTSRSGQRYIYGAEGILTSSHAQFSQSWATLVRPSNSRGNVATITEPLDQFSNQSITIYQATAGTGSLQIMRRGIGDDFQAGFFIGCPLFAALTTVGSLDLRQEYSSPGAMQLTRLRVEPIDTSCDRYPIGNDARGIETHTLVDAKRM